MRLRQALSWTYQAGEHGAAFQPVSAASRVFRLSTTTRSLTGQSRMWYGTSDWPRGNCPRYGLFPCSSPSASSSPASASTRRRIASDIHMPVLSSRFTCVTIRSTKPWDFASRRILSVPHTSSPAVCAIRRACLSSSRTVLSECSNAKANTASSPAPKSRFSHLDGTTRGSTTLSHS